MGLEPVERRPGRAARRSPRAPRRRRSGRSARRRGSGRAAGDGRKSSLTRTSPAAIALTSSPLEPGPECAQSRSAVWSSASGSDVASPIDAVPGRGRPTRPASPTAARQISTRRASAPTSLRTVLPERGIAEAELAMLGLHHLDEALGQRDRRRPRPRRRLLEPDDDQRGEGREHREPAVDRVRRPAPSTIPVAARAPRPSPASNSASPRSGAAVNRGNRKPSIGNLANRL